MRIYTRIKSKIIKHSGKLLRDTVLVVGARGITYITGGIWGILLARWLGAAFFGVYIYWFGVSSIFVTIARFGFNTFLTRELSANNEDADIIFCKYIKTYLIALLLAVFSLMVFLFYSEIDITYLFLGITTILIVTFENISQTISSWLFSKRKAPKVSRVSVVKSFLTLLTGFVLYKFGINVLLLIAVPLFFSFTKTIILAFYIYKDSGITFQKVFFSSLSKKDLHLIWTKTWSFGLFNIIAAIQVNSNAPILKVLGYTELVFGLLGAALRLKTIVALSSVAITQVILPKLAKDFAKSAEHMYNTFYRIFRPFYVLNLIMCMLLIFFSDTIVKVLFGQEYIESIDYMILFALGMLGPLMTLLSTSMVAINKQPFNLKWSIISYSLIPIIKLVFIPISGKIVIGWIEGVGGWVGFWVMLIFFHYFIHKRIKLSDFTILILLLILNIIIPYFVEINSISNYFVLPLLIITLYIAIKSKFLDFNTLIPNLSSQSFIIRFQRFITKPTKPGSMHA